MASGRKASGRPDSIRLCGRENIRRSPIGSTVKDSSAARMGASDVPAKIPDSTRSLRRPSDLNDGLRRKAFAGWPVAGRPSAGQTESDEDDIRSRAQDGRGGKIFAGRSVATCELTILLSFSGLRDAFLRTPSCESLPATGRPSLLGHESVRKPGSIATRKLTSFFSGLRMLSCERRPAKAFLPLAVLHSY